MTLLESRAMCSVGARDSVCIGLTYWSCSTFHRIPICCKLQRRNTTHRVRINALVLPMKFFCISWRQPKTGSWRPGILDPSKGITTRHYNADQCWPTSISAYQRFWFQMARAYLRRMLVGLCLASCPPRTSEYGWWMSCPSFRPRGQELARKEESK